MEKEIKEVSKTRDEISLRIKNEFVSFLNDLLQVFPNNSKLFICRIITHQIDKEEVCMMLENELLYLTTKDSIFNINFLNYENNFITNDMTFRLNDLYNIQNPFSDASHGVNKENQNKDNCNELECIYNWIDVLVYLIKQLKTTK
jgi:hypothetical protein